jgi:hypothetical protein
LLFRLVAAQSFCQCETPSASVLLYCATTKNMSSSRGARPRKSFFLRRRLKHANNSRIRQLQSNNTRHSTKFPPTPARLLLFESTRCCCIGFGPIQFISYYICASVRQSQTAATRKDESEKGPSVGPSPFSQRGLFYYSDCCYDIYAQCTMIQSSWLSSSPSL